MILIRHCRGFEELSACVELQKQTWGYEPEEVEPRKVFVLAGRLGGQVVGAFASADGGESGVDHAQCDAPSGAESLVGFAMALPAADTHRPPGLYLHSHMLAVRAGYRDRGIGRRLKLFQREDALERGILLMEWTFDPLEVKNAYLNIHRLGVVVRRYTPNFYGVSSSRLQAGLPTDRLHAEWWLASDRVRQALKEQPASCGFEGDSGAPDGEQIVVPRSLGEWKRDPARRQQVIRLQAENRVSFEQAFERGLAVVGFRLDEQGNGIYQLGRWEPPGNAGSPAGMSSDRQ